MNRAGVNSGGTSETEAGVDNVSRCDGGGGVCV